MTGFFRLLCLAPLSATLIAPAPAAHAQGCALPEDLSMRLPRHVGVASVAMAVDHAAAARRYVVDFKDRSLIVLEEGACPPRAAVTLIATGPVAGPAQLAVMADMLGETAPAQALPGGTPDAARLGAALASPDAVEAMEARRAAAWDLTAALSPQGMARASWAPLAFPWGVMLGVEVQLP